MADLKKQICRLCLSVICDENFTIIEDCTRDMLNVLLMNHDFDKGTSVICGVCSKKLFAAYEFKSTCLHTENTIKTHVYSAEEFPLDIRDIYMKEIENKQLLNMSDDTKVCRLCMELVAGEFISVRDIDSAIFQSFISEMNINFTKDPVVCEMCSESLHWHLDFLKNCVNAQGKLVGNIDNVGAVRIKNEDVKIKITEVNVKAEMIEADDVSIKLEECENDRIQNLESQQQVNQILTEPRLFKCYECDHQTKYKTHLALHCLRHRKASEVKMFKCEMCDFQTKYKRGLESHVSRHKDALKTETYKCNDCDYETKTKKYLSRHEKIHKDASEIQLYKCSKCDYQTRHHYGFSRHQIVHKDASETKIYKCDECDFQTKHSRSLSYHKINHVSVSKAEIYKCKDCDYHTNLKKNLSSHRVLMHRDVMYKCDECDFQTKHKKYLPRHKLSHKGGSEMKVYECDQCKYRTKCSSNFFRHDRLMHRDEFETDKNEKSNDESKTANQTGSKVEVKLEMLTETEEIVIKSEQCDSDRVERTSDPQRRRNRDVIEPRLFKCNECNFETKYKQHLATHCLRRHKDQSEIEMLKCDECDFQAKVKQSLKRHKLTHRDISEVKMYECDECDFQTKHRESIARHKFRHSQNKS